MALVLQVFGYKQDLTCQAKKTKKYEAKTY